MSFVDDQQAVATGVERIAGTREGLAEQLEGSAVALALDPVHRCDQARMLLPRVDVRSSVAAQATQELGVGDLELEAELLTHLVPPFDLQGRWADDQHLLDSMSGQELLCDEPSLDGLAEPDVVRDQQVGPGHPNGTNHRLELVVLDRNAAAERRLDRTRIGAGDRAPSDGVQQCPQVGTRIEPVRSRKPMVVGDASASTGLELPDHTEGLPHRVLIE